MYQPELEFDESDEVCDELESSTATALLEEPENQPARPRSGLASGAKNAAPMKSEMVTVCRRCGWYASLNQFVEIDAQWETDDEGEKEAAGAENIARSRLVGTGALVGPCGDRQRAGRNCGKHFSARADALRQ